jgi:hypothetical protein
MRRGDRGLGKCKHTRHRGRASRKKQAKEKEEKNDEKNYECVNEEAAIGRRKTERTERRDRRKK